MRADYRHYVTVLCGNERTYWHVQRYGNEKDVDNRNMQTAGGRGG